MAIGALLVGAAVLAATGFAFRDSIIETWHLRKLSSGDADKQGAALAWLSRHGSVAAVPALVRLNVSSPSAEARNVLDRILEVSDASVVPVLLRQLDERDPRVRRLVAGLFGAVGPGAAQAVPTLVPLCSDEDVIVRYRASLSLKEIGQPAVPSLSEALRADDPDARAHAAWLLGTIGQQATSAVPALLGAANDAEKRVRDEAVVALKRIRD